MAFRYYCLAISLATLILDSTAASTTTVYGRRKHQTVGSTIHFGPNRGDDEGGSGSSDYSAADETRFSQPDETSSSDDLHSPSYSQRYQRNLDRFLRPSSSSSGNAYHHPSSAVSSTVYGHRDPALDDPTVDESMQWAPSNGQVATYARGSTEEDSFTVQSAPTRGGALWGSSSSSKRPGSVARPSGRITFGPSSSSISVGSSYSIGGGGGGRGISSLRRAKRSPQMYGQQQQQQQQYYRRSYPPLPSYHSGGYNSKNNQIDFSLVPSNQYNGGGGGGYGYNQDPDDNCYYHTLVNGDSEMLFRLLLPIRLRGRTIVKKCIQPTPDVNDPRYKVLLRGSNQSSFGHLGANIKL